MINPVTKLISSVILALGGVVMVFTPIGNFIQSEGGSELLEDYQFINEWYDKHDKTAYEEELNGYAIDIEPEDFITSPSERLSTYIQQNRHTELDIDFGRMFRELPKQIKEEIKEEERVKNKFGQSFNIEDVITEKYIEWFYYNETDLIYTKKGNIKRSE